MRSRDRRERQAEPELFPKTLCRKGATGGSDFGITRYYTNKIKIEWLFWCIRRNMIYLKISGNLIVILALASNLCKDI